MDLRRTDEWDKFYPIRLSVTIVARCPNPLSKHSIWIWILDFGFWILTINLLPPAVVARPLPAIPVRNR
jgi:hypothetical protein